MAERFSGGLQGKEKALQASRKGGRATRAPEARRACYAGLVYRPQLVQLFEWRY